MGSMQEPVDDPFIGIESDDPFVPLEPGRGVTARSTTSADPVTAPIVGEFIGFDLDDTPLVRLPSALPGEVVRARATVQLARHQLNQQVIVICENCDARLPIILGVIQGQLAGESAVPLASRQINVQADNDRHVIRAEREIVLQCGDASITLTRAGKVIIKGNYVLSRSTGPNKLKGAVIDIN